MVEKVVSNGVHPVQKLELFPKSETQDEDSLAINYKLNIRRRTCISYIPRNANGSDQRCGCNRLRREHSWDVRDDDNSKWTKSKHTQAAVNNAWGYLPNSQSRYIRCDIETKPDVLTELMFKYWKMPPPRLIMCIIGGAKYFKLNERLEREFIKGIIQAALKADGWIVTSGFKTGVVQLVGEAIHDHKVTNPRSRIIAVGCSKWGATRNRHALIMNKSTNRTTIEMNNGNGKNEKGQQALEPNHTHFLLMDDGTYFGYDIGDYRTRLVKEISSHEDQHIPTITIVVEGGPDTLTAIYNDLCNGIPVVLIDGSGRVPNLLANFLTRTETMLNRTEKKIDDPTDWKQIIDVKETEKLKTLFADYEEEIRDGLKAISKGAKENFDDLFYDFLYCLQPAVRINIQIFSLDSDRDLDDTIFEAIIRAKQKKNSGNDGGQDREKLLDLALAWDALSVAKEHIIKEDLNDLNIESREKLFFTALRLDRSSFVQTFIKLNFNVSEMFYEIGVNRSLKFKWSKLRELYNDKNQKGRLCLLDKCLGKTEIESESELDRILRILIGDYMKPIYSRSNEDFLCCSNRSTRVRHASESNEESDSFIDMDDEGIQKCLDEFVYRDLFLWSILTNRIEMSKVFLNQMQTRICACLIASKIFKSYLHYATDNETKDVLSSHANEFEEFAHESLKHCYNYDEEKACEIAIRYISLFGGVSSLQVAVDADDKKFVGQPCCDQLLNNIWYDKMEPFQSTLSKRIRLFISIATFGFAAPFLIAFRQEHPLLESSKAKINENQLKINEIREEDNPLRIETMKRLNNYGINYSDTYKTKSKLLSKSSIDYFRRLKYFHQSPIIKYAYNAMSYLLFLLLFSYYLLFEFSIVDATNPMIHWTEIVVIIMITSMLIEDIRQFLCQENRSFTGKLSNYFITNYFFNFIRVTSYLLFYIGLILRFIGTNANPSTFTAAKIILAYDLEIWFIRSFTFLGIAQKMGPKLVMIRRMVIDLSFFTLIILIAMTAYGVASRTMFNYNTTTPITFDGRSLFRNLIYPTYYLMYGNIGTELTSLDADPDSSVSIATHVLLAFHMLFVNILLINLLIAMFTFTFDSVQTQTDLVWRYERYSLIREYFDRPPLFPPFILATHFLELLKSILRCLPTTSESYRKRIRPRVFKMVAANRKIDKDWSEFESYATNHYVRSLLTNLTTTTMNSTRRQEQTIVAEATNSNLTTMTMNPDVKAITDEISSLRKALIDMRTQSEETHRCMQWMMDAMERVKMSRDPKPKIQPTTNVND